jgi:hypothetical protein
MSNVKIERFTRADTARLYLEIVASGVGQTAETPSVSIQRVSDDLWLDDAESEWVPTRQDIDLVELDVANLPGIYYYDFDNTVDDNTGTSFLARFVNAGANALLEHRSVVFGAVQAVADPALCNITGTIYGADGEVAPGAKVLGTIIPVNYDSLGRGYQNSEVQLTYTDLLGQFELPFVRGLDVRLEIPSIGYDRRVTIPAASSALFSAL